MASVFHHTEENIAQFGLTLGVAMPLCQHRWRHLDVAPQLFCGMAAQKESVEKCGLALRIFEIQRDFRGNELCHCGHGERAVYRKASPRQVVPRPLCRVTGNRPPIPEIRCCIRPADTTPGLPGGSNSFRM